MENYFYHIRWPPLNVTIFILHVRNCVMVATQMSFVKNKRQESTGVSPLKNKNGFIHSDMYSSSKVEILNDQFVSTYTWEDNSDIQRKGTSDHPTMDSIRVHISTGA